MISKTLKSAVANAENNANLRVDGLVVKEATVGEGPTMKRMMTARSRKWQHDPETQQPYPDHFDRRNRDQDAREEESGQKKRESKKKRRAAKDDQERAPKAEDAAGGDAIEKSAVRNQKASSWDKKLIQLVFVSG